MRKQYLIIFMLLVSSVIKAQWLWNINKLEEIKQNINTPEYSAAFKSLIQDAERALNGGSYSVVFKEYTPPSGNKHDYASLSRYAWSDSTQADGLPYVLRDGNSNQELKKYDRIPLSSMANAVNALSLSYFYTGEEKYAAKAVDLLRIWFLNPETKMNPNLEYAQFIPGRNDWKGRAAGLIDTYSFVDMLNSIKLIENSDNYTPETEEALKQWFRHFAEWWQVSEQGVSERNSKNNHSLAYDVQLVTFALFSGDDEMARQVIDEYPEKRLYTQIEPDGSQPLELRRTLAFHYSEYNIRHMVDMAAMAKTLGVELYKMEDADGRSLYKAVDFLLPYLGKELSAWPYLQISGWNETLQALCEDLYRIVDIDPSRRDYLNAYKKYGKQELTDRNRLLFGAF